MTQIADPPVADEQSAPRLSLAEMVALRDPAQAPTSSEESATDALETAPQAQESASPALENDDAPEGVETERVPRSQIAEIKAQNEQLTVTKAELEQMVQDKIKEAADAQAELDRITAERAQHQAEFEQYAGTDTEYQELQKLTQAVGLRVASDPYASVTEEEQSKIARFRDLESRKQFSDLYNQRAWNTVLDAQRTDLGAAIKACPGVDQERINAAPTFTDIYRHFYEAGAASKQAEIDRLNTHLKGVQTKANSSVRAPAAGGASGAPSAGSGSATGIGGAIVDRLRRQGQWDE